MFHSLRERNQWPLAAGLLLSIALTTSSRASSRIDDALAEAYARLKADPTLKDEAARHQKLMAMADQYSQFAETAFKATEDLQNYSMKVRATGLAFRRPLAKIKQFDKSLKRITENPAFKNFQKYATAKGNVATVVGLGSRVASTLKNPNLAPSARSTLDVRNTQVTAAGAAVLRRTLPALQVDLDDFLTDNETAAPGPSAADATSTSNPPEPDPGGVAAASAGGGKAEKFSAAELNALREKVGEAFMPPEDTPEGWSKSHLDPSKLVARFKPLRLRKGYVLRAYQFAEGGNGNAVVWAMPADAEFPEPQDCPTLENHLLKAPKPFDALDDPMEAVEGDGSPKSYLMASLLRRQIREFGAMWHGMNWSVHYLLDTDPWKAGPPSDDQSPLEAPMSPRSEFKWLKSAPDDWRPCVEIEGDRVTVTFYTYCGIDRQTIYRHTDTYRTGKYRMRSRQEEIAVGPSGFAF